MNIFRNHLVFTILLFCVVSFALTISVSAWDEESGMTAVGSPELLWVGLEVSELSGNGTGWLEPGEQIQLAVNLVNTGTEAATGVIGSLSYQGLDTSAVVVFDKIATWPDLPAKGVPTQTTAPHFEIQVSSGVFCGAELPFQLEVSTAYGYFFVYNFEIKVGQRYPSNMIHDGVVDFTDQETNFWGVTAGNWLGYDVSWGDMNGDGFADAALGAPFEDTVYLVYGSSYMWVDTDLSSPPGTIISFYGVDPLGSTVAAGDINGDGYDDLIMGSQSFDEVIVVYGQAAYLSSMDVSTWVPGLAIFDGFTLDYFGNDVASIDIDGDGYDDLILAAYSADSYNNSRPNAGEVYIVYGKMDQWTTVDLSGTMPEGVIRIWGPVDNDRLGIAVGAGDINGDGYGDVILGASQSQSKLFLLYGSSIRWSDIDLTNTNPNVAFFYGEEPDDHFGRALESCDVNGDGYDDLVVGAPDADSLADARTNSGEVYLIYGKEEQWTDTFINNPPSGITRFWGRDSFDSVGRSIGCGDLNGDGSADPILGAPSADGDDNLKPDAGEAYVVFGRATPWADVDLTTPPSGIRTIYGADQSDFFSIGISAADINNDGYDDLILGAPEADSAGSGTSCGTGQVGDRCQAGEVYLMYGKPTDTLYQTTETYAYIDATGGTDLGLNCDDCSVEIPIGFEFPFYGEKFSSLYVSSNGLVSFRPIQDLISAVPDCNDTRRVPNILIAPFWADLNPENGPGGSGVYSLLDGTVPNRRLTIEWKDIPHFPDVGMATFEMTLYETTGHIIFQFQDLLFGNAAYDYGLTAVSSVENQTGAHTVNYSCLVNDILADGSAIRFVPTTPLFEEHGESGMGLWYYNRWLLTNDTCEPDQHTGDQAWYCGSNSVCDYTSGTDIRDLESPTIPDFPADGRLAYWFRRETEADIAKDLSKVQFVSSTTTDIQDIFDQNNTWVYSGVNNLFDYEGETAIIRFQFDRVDSNNNDFLGWMVDDIQLVGCNAVGVVAKAMSFGQPTTTCEGTSITLDAIGSFCGDGDLPSFQWLEDGTPLSGATQITYTIPGTHAPGTFDFTVAVTCAAAGTDESDPISVTIVAQPGNVGDTLQLVKVSAGSEIHFTWTDTTSSDEYRVLEDTIPAGSFSVQTGSAPSGSTGLTITMPAPNLVYYKVAGWNEVCSLGPIN